jgi:hypothetical protein
MMALARKLFAAASLCAAALWAPAATAVAATPGSAAASNPVTIAANSCGLPTSARPPSKYITSYTNCNTCMNESYRRSTNNPFGWRYYCTYNPSNNLNDLHQYLG